MWSGEYKMKKKTLYRQMRGNDATYVHIVSVCISTYLGTKC
jgi:hypothetical protein